MAPFTLEEARALIPELQKLLDEAKADLEKYWLRVKRANECYQSCEHDMGDTTADCTSPEEVNELRLRRARFQKAIDELSEAQQEYIARLEEWVESITNKGVILRDLHEGLIDFPAQREDLEYFLCWRTGESDISHWHLKSDGFIGRKPLAALVEFY